MKSYVGLTPIKQLGPMESPIDCSEKVPLGLREFAGYSQHSAGSTKYLSACDPCLSATAPPTCVTGGLEVRGRC